MRRKNITAAVSLAVAMAMTAGLTLSACDNNTPEPLTDSALTGTVLADFTQGEADTFFASDGWSNGSVFNALWTSDMVTYSDGAMHLSIEENPTGSEESNTGYYGGEARSYQYFGYGDYEVTMKPSGDTGTASTFFTCTGSYDTDEDGNPNPWDEIDIEFLGNDTTKVQFNYYVDSVGGHEYMYDLGFDAAESYHTYGFRWTSEYIVWFVDGTPVYKVTASESTPLPSTPGRILMNYWSGTSDAEGWMGKYTGGTDTADYTTIKTSATAIGELPEKVEVETFEGDWSTITALEPEFTSSYGDDSVHKITNGETSAEIVYEGVQGGTYSNVTMDISEAATDKNWVHFVIKNNADTECNVRMNVVSNGSAINSFGYGDGELLTTSSGEGTKITLAAGQEVEVEIKYTGVAATLEFMLDSFTYGDTGTYSGDVTISDIKVAAQGEIVIPETGVNEGVSINGETVVFGGNTETYIVNTDSESNSMNVTYSSLTGGTYLNLNTAVPAIASTSNVYTVDITNNGTESVTVRIDIDSSKTVNNTTACNVSATQDGEAVYTDTDWGGSTFTIAAGATATCEVTYDTSRGPVTIFYYIDSSTYGDTATHSGDVTFANAAFSGEGSVDTGDEEEGTVQGDAVALTFTSTDIYTVDNSGTAAESVSVSYTAVSGGSYSNISTNVATYAANNDTFSITITNNGEQSATVRVDIQGDAEADSNGNTACNLSATVSGATSYYTDTTYGGTSVTIAAGATATVVITYEDGGTHGNATTLIVFFDSATYGDTGTYANSITLSSFIFASSSED